MNKLHITKLLYTMLTIFNRIIKVIMTIGRNDFKMTYYILMLLEWLLWFKWSIQTICFYPVFLQIGSLISYFICDFILHLIFFITSSFHYSINNCHNNSCTDNFCPTNNNNCPYNNNTHNNCPNNNYPNNNCPNNSNRCM